ncbi:MAG: Hint domain-containing protein [Paracoccaceae bacterium]|nr:Hint domain-containing protein [Paracoccaceae bacterium]
MKTGYQGAFVISWAQTEVDGIVAPPLGALGVGACWQWWGAAVRVDGPNDMLILTGAEGEAETRARAARMVRRLMGAAVSGVDLAQVPEESLPEQSFTVTDGFQAYVVTLVALEDGRSRLLLFSGRVPPSDCELWVVERTLDLRPEGADGGTPGVICFTPGTRIETPRGAIAVEDLRAGDQVVTRDDGAQDIQWIGARRMSGARLYAMPHLRPVRIRTGAFGIGRPTGDLLVSPQHRMLIKGPAAQALFNEPEVLVRACDLVNGGAVRIEQGLPEVRYIHLLLARHQVLWANGMETESFHPASTALDMIAEDQRRDLLALLPRLADDPQSYGAYARRALRASEAAILRHDLAA